MAKKTSHAKKPRNHAAIWSKKFFGQADVITIFAEVKLTGLGDYLTTFLTNVHSTLPELLFIRFIKPNNLKNEVINKEFL